MATVDVQHVLTLKLSTDEFRIVTAALDGTLSEESEPEAQELARLLRVRRAQQVKATVSQMDKHLANLGVSEEK